MSSDNPYSALPASELPAAIPPDGMAPNFVNPPSLSRLPRIAIYVTLPLMIVFLALRLYSRCRITHTLGADDYLCTLAAAAITANCAVVLSYLDNPAGPHMWDIPVSRITAAFAEKTVMNTIIYNIAAIFIKSSIPTFYLRIFRPSGTARLAIWAVIIVVCLFYVASTIGFCIGCVPRPGEGWLSIAAQARCLVIDGPLTVAGGFVSTIADFYILLIPVFFISGLTGLSRKKKAGILAIFLTGFIACAFSIGGIYYRIVLNSTPGQDLTWTTMPVVLMNVGEINIGIVCSCMPIVFVLFKGVTREGYSWISKLRQQLSSNSNKGPRHVLNDPESGASDIQMVPYNKFGDGKQPSPLPEVPKGTLTGLRGFIRRAYRSTLSRTDGNDAQTGRDLMSTQTGLRTYASADYDYHQQLRQAFAGSPNK